MKELDVYNEEPRQRQRSLGGELLGKFQNIVEYRKSRAAPQHDSLAEYQIKLIQSAQIGAIY